MDKIEDFWVTVENFDRICLIVQPGTYVKNDVTEVTIFAHHVQRLQHGGVMDFVQKLQLENRLLFVLLQFGRLHGGAFSVQVLRLDCHT